MKIKITDSKDLRIFRRVKDDLSGKAVKTLLKMILGEVKDTSLKEVKDSSEKPERRLLKMILKDKLKDSAKPKVFENKFSKNKVVKLTKKEIEALDEPEFYPDIEVVARKLGVSERKAASFVCPDWDFFSEEDNTEIENMLKEAYPDLDLDYSGREPVDFILYHISDSDDFEDLKKFILDEWDGSSLEKKISLPSSGVEDIKKIVSKYLEKDEKLDIDYDGNLLKMEITKS